MPDFFNNKQYASQISSSGYAFKVFGYFYRLLLLIVVLSVGFAQRAYADSGSSVFTNKCAGCHTIGEGNKVGPDLKPTKDWTDSKLESEVKRMGPMAGGLTDDEVASLVSYLKNPVEQASTDSDTAKAESTESSEPVKEPEGELPGSAENGKLLFFGSKQFENGGMSCIACHQSGSHQGLGPDLKGISKKMKGRALVEACKNAPFKVMNAAYADHKITETEAFDLAKYLTEADAEEAESKPMPVPLYGGAFTLLVLACIAVGYRNRNSNVRDKLKRK